MRRWLLVGLGLVVGLAALYGVATSRGTPPHAEIDEASRARLEQVLREFEGGSPDRP